MVVDNICPSCTITQLQGARGVCALRALVIMILRKLLFLKLKQRSITTSRSQLYCILFKGEKGWKVDEVFGLSDFEELPSDNRKILDLILKLAFRATVVELQQVF